MYTSVHQGLCGGVTVRFDYNVGELKARGVLQHSWRVVVLWVIQLCGFLLHYD